MIPLPAKLLVRCARVDAAQPPEEGPSGVPYTVSYRTHPSDVLWSALHTLDGQAGPCVAVLLARMNLRSVTHGAGLQRSHSEARTYCCARYCVRANEAVSMVKLTVKTATGRGTRRCGLARARCLSGPGQCGRTGAPRTRVFIERVDSTRSAALVAAAPCSGQSHVSCSGG